MDDVVCCRAELQMLRYMQDLVPSIGVPTPMTPLLISVITVSDTRTVETDRSGRALVDFVESSGHILQSREIIVDDEALIREKVRMCCDGERSDVVLLTGGTGVTQRDVTPEAIRPLISKEIPGFGELFRMLSYQDIGAATIQSRAMAALCSRTLVFALPGSTGAVELAIEKIIRPQLDSDTRPCNFAQLLPRIGRDD